jgi:hypothetical protein
MQISQKNKRFFVINAEKSEVYREAFLGFYIEERSYV